MAGRLRAVAVVSSGDRQELASGSVLCEEIGLDESAGIEPFTYWWIPNGDGSMGWMLEKSRFQPEDLEPIPWKVRPVDFIPNFDGTFDDELLVDREALKTSSCC